jgi:predicted phage gp36 major capsid-like protein
MIIEERERETWQPGRKHVVQPDAEAENHGRDRGERDGSVTNQGAATEGRQAVRHDTKCRQHDRIHPWVAEHPEQMLPEHRLSALSNRKEMRAEVTVHP